jgi:D-glycero-D-manno-heptose 1,7-bisphosphate phosphatase
MSGEPRFVLWIDRDGTLVDDPGYLDDPELLRLLPGAARALARLNAAGALTVLVSNQSGIARGLMSRATVDRIHDALKSQLARDAARLDHIEICPHLPSELLPPDSVGCDCRKPLPGMVLRARSELKLEAWTGPEFVVGDKSADMLLARAVGAYAVLVRTGDGRRAEAELATRAVDHVADDLDGAADWILAHPDLGAGG